MEFKSVFNIQFFNRSDINSGYLSAVVILILFGIAVVRIFYADVNSELVMYIRSTYRGQNKVYNNKLIILLITAAVLAILKNVINFLPQIIYGSAGDWLNPIQCLEPDSPYNISILTFFIIQILFTLSSYMFYGMIIVIVSVSSQKIVNSLIAVVITGGTWLLYHYIVAIRFGTPGIENKWYTFVSRYIGSPHALYYPRSYFNKLEFVRMGNIPFKPVTVYMICTIPLIIAMYFTGRYIYVKRAGDKMLEVKNLYKKYGKKCVLNNMNYLFTPGIYGLLGPNGAGKSTLMNIISDVIDSSEGSVEYMGKILKI